MTKIFNVATIVSAIILASCGGSNSPEVDKSIMPAAHTSNAINPNSSQAVDVQSVQPIQAVPSPSRQFPIHRLQEQKTLQHLHK